MAESKLLIITAPSGAGKTTIVRHLMEKFPELEFSVSATTRPSRTNEIDGEDYYFMSVENFMKEVDSLAFVEWEQVYPGKYYGTLKSEVEEKLQSGTSLIFDIDVKGAMNLKKQFPENSLSIFVKTPNLQTLIERLSQRSTEDADELRTRIQKAKKELLYEHNFDRIVINDVLDETLSKVEALVSTFLNNN